jgi:hypothetical protein
MGDFIDTLGGFVGDAWNTIVGILFSIYDFFHIFLPGPILPVVLGGLAFAGLMWFLFKR